jgi:Flp pilus assembly pilin Flp
MASLPSARPLGARNLSVLTARWHRALRAHETSAISTPADWPDLCIPVPRKLEPDASVVPFSARRFELRRNQMNEIKKLVKDTRGANLVEYIIIVGVVALLAIVAFTTFGGDVQKKITDQGKTVSGINAAAK